MIQYYPCAPACLMSILSAYGYSSKRHCSVYIKIHRKQFRLPCLARTLGQRWIRVIFPSWETEKSASSRMAAWARPNPGRISNQPYLPEQGMCEPPASQSGDGERKRTEKQSITFRDQCSKNPLQARASSGQILSVEERQGSVLLNLSERKDQTPSKNLRRSAERRDLNTQ